MPGEYHGGLGDGVSGCDAKTAAGERMNILQALSIGAGLRMTMAIVLIAFVPLSAQVQTKSSVRKPLKKKSKSVLVKPSSVAADSVARADSLRALERVRAEVDSLRRQQQAEADRRREDSLKAITLRVVPQTAFGLGERLVFDVNYGFITAGEATMAIGSYESVAGRKCYRVEFAVNSLPSFSWIYRVEDRYYTFIDVEAIVPWRFEQHIREGNYQRDFVADFNQFRHRAKTTEGEYEIPPYVHDIMSAFYYARTMDYSQSKPGDMYTLFNFYKDKSHELGVRFLGRQELEVAAGTFNTIVVEPLVKEGGLFKSEGRIVIWLSDDEVKIPLRVNTKVVIGSIDTELREYSGLRGTLKARIK
jgi:hypothetical protein